MGYELLTIDSDIQYIKDDIFQDMLTDFIRETLWGPGHVSDIELSEQFFYISDEVVIWLIDRWATEIFAQDIYNKVYEDILIPEHYTYFFDPHWFAADFYKEQILEKNEYLHTQLIDEFLIQLKRKRYGYSQEDYKGMLKSAGTTLVGRNTYLFPQREVW